MTRRAVLTGDIMGSTKVPRAVLEATFGTLEAAAAGAAIWCGGPLRLTRHRGDGWQALIHDPSRALRAALILIAALRADGRLPTRIAVGLGAVDVPGERDLSDADGPAFHAAGRALDAMPRGRRLILAADGVPDLAPALVVFCDVVSAGWSVAQAAAMRLGLAPDAPTQARIGEGFGITQQAVADRLDGAYFSGFEAATAAFEAAVAAQAH